MKIPTLLLTTVSLIALATQSIAERELETEDSASHIVTGIVSKVFKRDGKENHEYLVAIRIGEIIKGDGYQKGDTIFAYAYQRKADAPRVPASSGHSAVPKAGQQIQARIKRGTGTMEALYPNWFDVLEPKSAEDKISEESSPDTPKEQEEKGRGKHDTARLEGMKTAIADIEKGVLRQKEYPALPYGPGHTKFVRLLKSECGVEWQVVKTGKPAPSQEARADLRRKTAAYNTVMQAEIEHRFGRDLLAKLKKKARGR